MNRRWRSILCIAAASTLTFVAHALWKGSTPALAQSGGADPVTFCADVTEIPALECQALVALYNTSNGDGWFNNSGWVQTTTPCSWYAVACEGGHVTRLALGSNNLVGSISPELRNLTSLEHLDLSWNLLSGSIPPELASLASLLHLELQGNELSGSIPSELGGLASLQTLNLSWNQLSGSIPPQLGNLANLRTLSLEWNQQLSGSIPAELGNLTNLTTLSLYVNQLSGSLPVELGNLTNLEWLSLMFNQLTGSIPSELGNLTNLRLLDLGYNQLSGSVPAELGNLSNLYLLALSSNGLSGTLPPELGNLVNLSSLYLSDNLFSGDLPAWIGSLASLGWLDASNSGFSGTIPSWVGSMGSLIWLDLSDNQLSGTLPSELGALTGLGGLDLSGNQLSGGIPSWIGNMTGLAQLLLSRNKLSGSIPPEIGNTDLWVLYLDSNQLEGDVPLAITSLPHLIDVDIGYNKLTASDPEVLDLLDIVDPDWSDTQTVAPTALQATAVSGSSVQLTWTAIAYTGDGGHYEVSYATTPGGPYTVDGTTVDKSASSYVVEGLTPGELYHFVVRTYTPAHGDQQSDLWSEYSEEVSNDFDTDGVPDDVEDGAPNGGDGNADGTADSEQSNVASLPNSADGQYVTLVSPDGTILAGVAAVENPSPGDAPPGVEFPVGFFEFRVQGIAAGGATDVTLLLPPDTTVDTYYKYGPTPGNPSEHWYEFLMDGTTGAEILSDRVILHFVDGETGDDDLSANAELVEPGGPSAFANQPPVVRPIAAPLDPVQAGTIVSATASFEDADALDTHTALWEWGDSNTSPGTVDETAGSVSGTHVYTSAGVYTVRLTVTDKAGESDVSAFQFIVVYDPDGGFVTGGGWIDSPPEAYRPQPALTGKATFGFVSKYVRGASTPSGETQFQFKVADLSFHSDTYQWLVVAGARAQFKGIGSVNGEGDYGFMLTAIDGQLPGGGSGDRFRIKIWDRATDQLVYDNQYLAPNDADPATPLAGGSIVIHKPN